MRGRSAKSHFLCVVYHVLARYSILLMFTYENYSKTIIRLILGSVNIGEYLPRLRLGKYSPTFTSPSANNC